MKEVGDILISRASCFNCSLNDATSNQPANAHIANVFAENHVDFSVSFSPGKEADFVKDFMAKMTADFKQDTKQFLTKIFKGALYHRLKNEGVVLATKVQNKLHTRLVGRS